MIVDTVNWLPGKNWYLCQPLDTVHDVGRTRKSFWILRKNRSRVRRNTCLGTYPVTMKSGFMATTGGLGIGRARMSPADVLSHRKAPCGRDFLISFALRTDHHGNHVHFAFPSFNGKKRPKHERKRNYSQVFPKICHRSSELRDHHGPLFQLSQSLFCGG